MTEVSDKAAYDGSPAADAAPREACLPSACGHRSVIGSFDEFGCHLRNRCQDCGYTVEWAT